MTMDLNDLQIIANTDLNTYINAHSVPGNTIAELYTNELNSQASASGLANVVNQASYLQNLFLNATPDAVASNMTSKIIAERQDPNIDFSVGGTDKLKFEWKFLQIDAQARINDINDGGTGELTVEQFNANMTDALEFVGLGPEVNTLHIPLSLINGENSHVAQTIFNELIAQEQGWLETLRSSFAYNGTGLMAGINQLLNGPTVEIPQAAANIAELAQWKQDGIAGASQYVDTYTGNPNNLSGTLKLVQYAMGLGESFLADFSKFTDEVLMAGAHLSRGDHAAASAALSKAISIPFASTLENIKLNLQDLGELTNDAIHEFLTLTSGVANKITGNSQVSNAINSFIEFGQDFGFLSKTPPALNGPSGLSLTYDNGFAFDAYTLINKNLFESNSGLSLNTLLGYSQNAHWNDNLFTIASGAEYLLAQDNMVWALGAGSGFGAYQAYDFGQLSYTNQNPFTAPNNDMYMDFATYFDNGIVDHSLMNGLIDFQGGVMLGGANYLATMSPSMVNGDGFFNVMSSSVPVDDLRPGAGTLGSSVSFLSDWGRAIGDVWNGIANNFSWSWNSATSTPTSSFVTAPFQYASNLISSSLSLLNIDPLVLDIDGDGVELISYEDSNATFDVDNDGFLENTGWLNNDDALLVHDVNSDGIINDITETISEYYLAAPGTGPLYEDGLDALATLDSNDDHTFNASDTAFTTLRVWRDLNEDGRTDAGELKTLAQMGITSIDLDRVVVSRQELAGNPVLSRSTMVIDGQTHAVAAVDFRTNPVGYEWNVLPEGAVLTNEDGTNKTYTITEMDGATVTFASLDDVNTVIGSKGNDTITGDAESNWIIGGPGSDTLFGGDGNDVLVIDFEDDVNNLDAGSGFDVVQVSGPRGVVLNLHDINAEVAIGGDGNDTFLSGGGTNVFVRGGAGNDVIIGGNADDALSGEDGDDFIDGAYENDIIRGHRGNDTLIGGEGEDFIDGGKDDDIIYGGNEDDLLIGGAGNDKLFGGDLYDIAEYSGKISEYDIVNLGNGKFQVADRVADRDGTDILEDIEGLNFKNISGVGLAMPNPFTADDIIAVTGSGPYTITASSILGNDIDFQGDALHITSVSDIIGGSASVSEGNVIFTPDSSYKGVFSFKYKVADSGNNAGANVVNDANGESQEVKGTVYLQQDYHPDDPLFYSQWYLSDANILPVWDDYTGKNVHVGFFEPSVMDINHADIVDNISQDTIDNTDQTIIGDHATLVAGVVAASRNNLGVVGVAYDSTVSGTSIGEGSALNLNVINDFKLYDVVNNSWGITLPFADSFYLSPGNELPYQDAAAYGRNGLGTIVVTSAGNERQEGGDADASNFRNNRFTIAVGAINKNADLGSIEITLDAFSNRGSNILVSGPGSNITSTSVLLENSNGSIFGSNYEAAEGTSLATPIISGIAALMLEANAELGYRDVQEILAYTAREVNDSNTDWQENGAANHNGGGLHFSHDYGFGNVDALAAVRLAETWNRQQTFYNESNGSSTKTPSSGTLSHNQIFTDTINFIPSQALIAEHVEVTLDIEHSRLGDLVITLVSPNGTESILLDRLSKVTTDSGDFGHGAFDSTYTFSTVANWGENPSGTWTLKIEDKVTGEAGVLNNWKLQVYGKLASIDDLYIYNNEYASVTDSNAKIIQDSSGDDTINTAAVSGNITLNLVAGTNSTVAGNTLTVANGTTVERAFTGDGNDTITGNTSNNLLFAGRGNDVLSGGDGDDWLIGAQGVNVINGGDGKDRFVIRNGDEGTHTIQDFDVAEDILVLAGYSGLYQSMDDLDINAVGSDAIITLPDGQEIILENVAINSLNNTNFLFSGEFSIRDTALTVQEYFGTEGNDTETKSGANKFIMYGKGGNDQLTGGTGGDDIYGGTGDDIIHGGDGNDIIYGGIAGNAFVGNTIYGGAGNDIIHLEDGLNAVYGGTGVDTFVIHRDLIDNGGIRVAYIEGGISFYNDYNDPIFDFDVTSELIDLREFSEVNSFDDLYYSVSNIEGSYFLTVSIIDGYDTTIENEENSLIAQNDFFYMPDPELGVSGNLLADNGYGADSGLPETILSITPGTYETENDGTVVIEADGDFVYTPDENLEGNDFFRYTLVDNNGNHVTARVDINTGIDPIAEDDDFVMWGTSTVSGNLLSDNGSGVDKKAPGRTLSVAAGTFETEEGGTVVIQANGNFVYTPASNHEGDDSFDYTLIDDLDNEVEGSVSIEQKFLDAKDDVFFIYQSDATVSGNVLDDNGHGADRGLNSLLSVTPGTYETDEGGTVVIQANGYFIYTPADMSFGEDEFSYTLLDSQNHEAEGTVKIVQPDPIVVQSFTLIDLDQGELSPDNFIFSDNSIPKAFSDNFSTAEDMPLSFVTADLIGNDSDSEDGAPVFSQIVHGPQHGQLVDDGDGNFTYTPNNNYIGADNFTYEVIDADGASATSLVTINVTPANDAPSSEMGTIVSKKTGLPFTLLAQFTDSDGDVLTYSATLQNGSPLPSWLSFDPETRILSGATPTLPESVLLRFTASDGTVQSHHDVTLSITTRVPVAAIDELEGDEDINITGNVLADNGNGVDSDPDGDDLTVQAGTFASLHGGSVIIEADGDFSYTPAVNYNGEDSFNYTLLDDQGGSTIGVVNLTLDAVNDNPLAKDDSFTATENHDKTGNLLNNNGNGVDADVDGDSVTVTTGTFTTVEGGTIVIASNGSFTYTPDTNFTGNDSYNYTLNDGNGGSDTGTVMFNVTTNQDPVAQNDSFNGTEDQNITGNVLSNNGNGADSDPENDSLSVTSGTFSTAQAGSVAITSNGSFTYTPASNFNGSDSFNYTVNDGKGGNDTATVNLTVSAVNDAPSVTNNGGSVSEDSTLVLTTAMLTGSDIDNTTAQLLFTLSSLPAHGTVKKSGSTLAVSDTFTINDISNGLVTYVSAANYNGSDSFGFSLSDGTATVSGNTFNITVNSVNDAPVAADDTFVGSEDDNVTGNLLSNNGAGADSDIDNDTLTVTSGTFSTSHGSVTVSSNGNFTYTPTANYFGTDSFNYTLNDGHSGSDTGTANLTIESDGPNLIEGTSSSETLTGTANADLINGYAGNDIINANAGDDTLSGGDGNDTLNGGAGADSLTGGANNDIFILNDTTFSGVDTIQDFNSSNDKIIIANLFPYYDPWIHTITDYVQITDSGSNSILKVDIDGGGNSFVQVATIIGVTGLTNELALQNSDTVRTYNTISGTTGADTLTGGANFDYIFADYGNDTLYGGAGNDRLDGAWDNDTLYGQDGNDVLEAGSGNDTLYGGDGNDTMIGENGNDIFYGGAGADTITTGNNSDIIVLDDTTFSGVDTIQDFSSSNDKIIIANLFPYYDPWIHTITDYVQITDSGSNSILKVDIDGGGNSFVQVATIIGVTGLTNELALQNSDTVRTYNTISGTTGADTLTGGANFDYIFADYGNDTLYGGAGNDRLDGAWDNDTLYGQDGNDVLEAGSGNDTLYGGDGNDTMIGENGNDIFYGGAGADTITTGNNSDIIVLDDTTFSGVDTIQDFSSSNDKIIIANLFPYYDPWIHNITHYVQIVDSGSNSILSVDIDGGGNSFVQVATIIGVTGLTNELALQNSDTVRTYNTISGTTGADTLTGGANFDYIFADYGNDTLYGGAGNDRLDGAWDNDTLYGQDGNDVLEAGSGNDTLYGGDGNDTMIGENGNDIFYGGAGADTITTGNNSDIIVFDSTAFSGIDTVQDFNSSSDKIDIADVLVGYDALTEAITDFVQITTSGSNSILSVDADGGANNFVQIATLVGITGLTDEEALETAGKLITV